MSDHPTLSRRDLLRLAVTAAVALAAGAQSRELGAIRQTWHDALAGRLSALLPHRDSAKVIGAAYLRQYPHELSSRALLERLTASHAQADRAWLAATDEQLYQLLAQTMRDDFAADRVVTLQGWILSETEARLCALAILV